MLPTLHTARQAVHTILRQHRRPQPPVAHRMHSTAPGLWHSNLVLSSQRHLHLFFTATMSAFLTGAPRGHNHNPMHSNAVALPLAATEHYVPTCIADRNQRCVLTACHDGAIESLTTYIHFQTCRVHLMSHSCAVAHSGPLIRCIQTMQPACHGAVIPCVGGPQTWQRSCTPHRFTQETTF